MTLPHPELELSAACQHAARPLSLSKPLFLHCQVNVKGTGWHGVTPFENTVDLQNQANGKRSTGIQTRPANAP